MEWFLYMIKLWFWFLFYIISRIYLPKYHCLYIRFMHKWIRAFWYFVVNVTNTIIREGRHVTNMYWIVKYLLPINIFLNKIKNYDESIDKMWYFGSVCFNA